MHGRFWVPKNICVYASVFLLASAAWTGILRLYYLHSDLAGQAGEEAFPFFDFNRAGNLGEWFLSLMWLGISLFSFMMATLVWSRRKLHLAVVSVPKEINGATVGEFGKYHGMTRLLFWGILGLFSLVMSADTVCRFVPFLYGRAVDAVRESAGENGDASLLTISLIAIGVFLLLVVFSAVRDYIRGFSLAKLCIRGAFGLTVLLLLPSLFFALPVPGSAPDTRAVPRGSAGQPERRTEDGGEPDGYTAPRSSYRTISYEKGAFKDADLSSEDFTLESVFGMNVSFEEKLSLDRTLEESLHMKESLEEYLFERLPKLNLAQARTLLRRGFYGYFLALLAGSLGLLARIERKEYDDLIARQTLLRMQTPVGVPSAGLLRDIWKISK